MYVCMYVYGEIYSMDIEKDRGIYIYTYIFSRGRSREHITGVMFYVYRNARIDYGGTKLPTKEVYVYINICVYECVVYEQTEVTFMRAIAFCPTEIYRS